MMNDLTITTKARDFIDELSEDYFSEDRRIINIDKVIREILGFKLDIFFDFGPINPKKGEQFFTSDILGNSEAVTLMDEKRIITKTSNAPRQRFTLCHEIAHIVLDHKKQSKNNEREADEFAAELMFPYFKFKNDIQNLSVCVETISELEKLYQASREATWINFAKKHSKSIAMAGLDNNFRVGYCFGSSSFPEKIINFIGTKINLPKVYFDGVLKHQIKINHRIFNIEAIRCNAGTGSLVLIKSEEL
ncbi:MAG: ImmA/IrrE family metallo-endopeptidase [bacterium]